MAELITMCKYRDFLESNLWESGQPLLSRCPEKCSHLSINDYSVFKTWEWALRNGWHHWLLYRNYVISATVCSPVLKRTPCISSFELHHRLSWQYATDSLAFLYEVGEGETPVMVRITCTKDILWHFFCGNDSLVQENKTTNRFVKFEVLTLVPMKIPVFWYWNNAM
jgi:hypothetical protein